MLRIPPIVASIIFACVSLVSAEFDEFYFPSNATNYVCPGIKFGCIPPMICAHESLTDQFYCCSPGAKDAICWKGNSDCDGGDKKTPSGSQQSCSNGANAFCCLKSREECTATKDQINVCWSTVDNPVANLSDTKMNDTFSSLSSAHPSASSFTISLAALQATATPTTSLPISASASSLSSASASTTSTTAIPTAATSNDDKGISGGAIGGIVGGVVGGLAILGVIGFLLFRRRRNNAHAHAPVASGSPSEHEHEQAHSNPYEMETYNQYGGMAEAPVPTEKYAYHAEGAISPGSQYRDVPEVHGSAVGAPVAYEMPGSAPVEMDGSEPVRRT